jgi:hypothetical protein
VVLSIALGVFAIGTIAQMYLLVTDDLAASYAAVHPAHATVFTDDPFDTELVHVTARPRRTSPATTGWARCAC